MRLYAYIAAGLLLLAIVAGVVLHFKADARTRDKLATLEAQAKDVLVATREASSNPKLSWEGVAGQVTALGESNRTLRVSIGTQNDRIDQLAREAVAARAKAAELKKIADRAEAQRASALKRLSDMGATPGTRDDCLTLLREAEEALDLVREAGL